MTFSLKNTIYSIGGISPIKEICRRWNGLAGILCYHSVLPDNELINFEVPYTTLSIKYELFDNYKLRKLENNKKNFENLENYYSISLLEKAKNDAIKLHKTVDTILIGWDVKLTKDKYYFLEGNYLPGNIFFYDLYYIDKLELCSKIKY